MVFKRVRNDELSSYLQNLSPPTQTVSNRKFFDISQDKQLGGGPRLSFRPSDWPAVVFQNLVASFFSNAHRFPISRRFAYLRSSFEPSLGVTPTIEH